MTDSQPTSRNKTARISPRTRAWLFRVILLGACLLLIPWIRNNYQPLLPDFIEYWAAGSLNLAGQNPYGRTELLAVQQPLGWNENDPLMMWNPPWALPVVMPFGLLPYDISRLVWYFIQIATVMYCANAFWRLYGGPQRWKWVSWATALTAYYTIYVLIFGQISSFILLGMTCFILLIDGGKNAENRQSGFLQWRPTDFLAGAAAILIAIKPQSFYLFFPVLLVWAIYARRYWVIVGSGSTILVALLISAVFNPQVVGQYIQAIRHYPPEQWATPTLGYWARSLFGEDLFWLQFPSVLVGLAWALIYWRKKANHWNWSQALPLLALVSLITTAYAWTHDQIILIPAGLHILARLFAHKDRWRPTAIVWMVTWGLFHLGTIPLHFGQSDDKFVWQAPAILVLYLWGRRITD